MFTRRAGVKISDLSADSQKILAAKGWTLDSGTYRLSEDVVNNHRDKRKTDYLNRSATFPKGKLFLVRILDREGLYDPLCVYLTAAPDNQISQYAHNGLLSKDLAAKLVPVHDLESALLDYSDSDYVTPRDILEYLHVHLLDIDMIEKIAYKIAEKNHMEWKEAERLEKA